jgi:hypothetical protein
MADYQRFLSDNAASIRDFKALQQNAFEQERQRWKEQLPELLSSTGEVTPPPDTQTLSLDPNCRAVAAAVQSLRDHLHPSLFLYVDVRQALLANQIDNRSLAVYLANVWHEFRRSGILPSLGTATDSMLPTVEILRQLNFLKGPAAFELMARSGNYYLFLMALFAPFFERRQRRLGTPGIAYYEAFARCAFRSARDHGLADELALKDVYHHLSENLGHVRLALASLN